MNLSALWTNLASQYPAWLNPIWLDRLAVVVTAALVFLIAQSAAQLTWQAIPVPTLPDAPSTVMSQDTDMQTTQRLASDYAVIATWPLFGTAPVAKAPPPPPPPPPVPQQPPETPLNLRLVGVFHSTTGRFTPRALIAEGNNPEKNYTVGAELPGGARLEQVMPEEVVLSRAGRLERLRLPKESPSNRPFGAGGLDFLPQPSAEMPPMDGQSDMPVMEPQSLAPIDNTAVISQLRQEALARPSSLQDLAFVSPYMQNGQFIGFRLRPGRNRQLLGQLGLQAGDVVTQVNGMRLESPAQGLTALQDLMSADQITLQVLRDGTEFPLSFSLNSQ